MIELFKNPSYNFIDRRRWAYAASVAMMLIALVSLLVQGVRYDLDFTGGTLIQVRFAAPVDSASLRAALVTIRLSDSVIQEFGDSREYIVRTSQGASTVGEVAKSFEAALRSHPSLGAFEIRRVEFVGPQVGRDLQTQAVYAVLAAVIGILIYIGFRVDLNQTLSRTVLTSLTTFLASVVLFLFGGAALEGFAFVLTVGIVTGTYSTVYIAAALVVDWTLYVERPRTLEHRPRSTT